MIAGAVIDGMGTTRARCVLAPNPSPMTLDGTNTWILAEPGSPRAVVVDPVRPGDPHVDPRVGLPFGLRVAEGEETREGGCEDARDSRAGASRETYR